MVRSSAIQGGSVRKKKRKKDVTQELSSGRIKEDPWFECKLPVDHHAPCCLFGSILMVTAAMHVHVVPWFHYMHYQVTPLLAAGSCCPP